MNRGINIALLTLMTVFYAATGEAICRSTLLNGGGANDGEGNDDEGREWPPEIQEQLELAVDHSDLNTIRELLATGADIDGLGLWWTPLARAAQLNRLEIAGYLLSRDANPNAPDTHGRFPIEWAVQQGYHEMVELLLDHGADLETRMTMFDPEGTLLEVAIRSGYDRSGEEHDHGSFRSQDRMVELLYRRGFQIPPDRFDSTLRMAAKSGSTYALRRVVDETEFDATQFERFNREQGTSLLHIALKEASMRDPATLLGIVRILVRAGHDVNMRAGGDPNGLTPLRVAHPPRRVADYLREMGAQ